LFSVTVNSAVTKILTTGSTLETINRKHQPSSGKEGRKEGRKKERKKEKKRKGKETKG
jgi:hypothetical protein